MLEISHPGDLKKQLDHWLEVEFSNINTDKFCRQLLAYSPEFKNVVLDCVQQICATNIQLAAHFLTRIDEQVECMPVDILYEWVSHAIDQYDRQGLNSAATVFDETEKFIRLAQTRLTGALLSEAKNILASFLRGLSGRELKIEPTGSLAHTDTSTLFLPETVIAYEDKTSNFMLLKNMLTFCWAQTRYGSFSVPVFDQLKQLTPQALQWYAALEAQRLFAILRTELPGQARQMQKACDDLMSAPWAFSPEIRAHLEKSTTVAQDSLILLDKIDLRRAAPVLPFQGEINLNLIEREMNLRIQREKAYLQVRLSELVKEQKGKQEETSLDVPDEQPKIKLKQNVNDELEFELSIQADMLGIPEDVQATLSSIQLDFGQIPDDYLVAAGPGQYRVEDYQEKKRNPEDVWSGTYHEEGAFLYPEWDFQRQRYRNDWCVVRELDVNPARDSFYAATLERYAHLVKSIRHKFEILRDEHKTTRKQAFGEDVDLDAVVESWSDMANGKESSSRLFTHRQKLGRNIAVMFMVDMSGSTKGWINQAEREALLLLCEAIETLGDQYAIFGFSGTTRKRCELYRVKSFADNYDEHTIARISGIEAKDYTRMGAAIRHLTMRLNEIDAAAKLLITLSDGKPEDYDAYYRTEYGIHDTRQALHEARRSGIRPFCITVDEHAAEYLPQLYGKANYTVLQEVAHLPLKVSDIYRKLTS